MSKAVMQRVLEVLVRVNASPHLQDLHHAFDEEITALKQALAEPECKCTMRQKMVGDGCAVCNPERAKDLAEPQTTHWEGCEAVHPECRKPEQEPVAWIQKTAVDWLTTTSSNAYIITTVMKNTNDEAYVPLYTAPTPRKPLTDEELEPLLGALPCYDIGNSDLINFARAVIAAYEAKQGEQT